MSLTSRVSVAVVACAAAAPASGQIVDTASVATLLAGLRADGNSAAVTARLAQDLRPHAPAELDALADSLVAIAVSYRAGDPLSDLRAAERATHAIAMAAHSGRIAERIEWLQARGTTRPPVPYNAAFDRLVQVVESSAEVRIKAGALWLITQLPQTERAAHYLGDVATWNSSLARTAIRYLVTDMGDLGLPVLRRLYETDAVVEQTAREHIIGVATTYGWIR